MNTSLREPAAGILLVVGVAVLIGIVTLFNWPAGVTGATTQDACTVPKDGVHFSASTLFCTGTYLLPLGIHVTGQDITLDCNQAVLQGIGKNTGITVEGNNIILKDCHLSEYDTGIATHGREHFFEGVSFSWVRQDISRD